MEPHTARNDPTSSESQASSTLRVSLSSHGALPYLFIGSGISRRYLGLPDWEGLLRKFATEAGEDFNYHLASVDGDLPAAATRIAHAFHSHWWNNPAYESQRQKHADEVRDKEGGLKVAIAEYVRSGDSLKPGVPGVDSPELAMEVDLLRRAVVDGVITTNYDSLTDQVFPSFCSYVGQDELMMSDAQFIAETYKIHGAASQPRSIVLTKGDYDLFSRRNHYLAAKLLTIFAEHPVLFVGYSLSDEYLNEILDNIATAVGPSRLGELGKRIYFVEWNQDSSSEIRIEQTSLQREDYRLPITRIETNRFSWIWEVLGGLERPFPAAILRELRKHVFELVTRPDPSQSREIVRAIPIDSDGAEGYRVVFGVGAFSDEDLENLSTIGRALRRDDVEQDVLGIRERGLDAENLLATGVSEHIRAQSNSYLPVHKYLLETGRIAADGTIDFGGLPEVVQKMAERDLTPSAESRSRFDRDILGTLTTPREVTESNLATYFKLDCLLLLDPEGYDLDDLRDVLAELYGRSDISSNRSSFRRAICMYDRQRSLKAAKEGRLSFD